VQHLSLCVRALRLRLDELLPQHTCLLAPGGTLRRKGGSCVRRRCLQLGDVDLHGGRTLLAGGQLLAQGLQRCILRSCFSLRLRRRVARCRQLGLQLCNAATLRIQLHLQRRGGGALRLQLLHKAGLPVCGLLRRFMRSM
jgi:hypothetical protein